MISENISFAGPHGALEGVLAYSSKQPPWFAAVLVPPHPLLGGDMNNNVLRGLEAELVDRGGATLRFNYTGVGNSHGPSVLDVEKIDTFLASSHMADEAERHHDLASAVATMRASVDPSVPLLVVGYSFGCAVIAWWLAHDPATALAATAGPQGQSPPPCDSQAVAPPQAPLRDSAASGCRAVVCIAPTTTRHDYAGLARSSMPKLVLASENDFATSPGSLRAELAGWRGPLRLELAKLDDHFFRGCESWLAERIVPFFASVVRVPPTVTAAGSCPVAPRGEPRAAIPDPGAKQSESAAPTDAIC